MTLKSVRSTLQEQPLEAFYKKDVLRNCEKFTGKHCAGVSF